MFPRKHSPRALLFSQENRHTPPTLIRGRARVATQPVLAHEAVENCLPLPGAVLTFLGILSGAERLFRSRSTPERVQRFTRPYVLRDDKT